MKKLKLKLLTRINLIAASLIAFLGIGGCKQQKAAVKTSEVNEQECSKESFRPVPVKYGVPRAGYSVEGVVVDTEGIPQQHTVLISTRKDMEGAFEVNTDESGRFSTYFSGFPADSLYFKVGGISTAEPIKYSEGVDDFDRGDTKTEVVITLPSAPDNGRVLVKYGVPPRTLRE